MAYNIYPLLPVEAKIKIYPRDWLYLQSLNSDKHLPQITFRGQFFRRRHFALVSI